MIDVKASAVSLGNPGRSDVSVGMRVFHSKFGYGTVAEIEGNKLEIDFEKAGRKRVLDSFVSVEPSAATPPLHVRSARREADAGAAGQGPPKIGLKKRRPP